MRARDAFVHRQNVANFNQHLRNAADEAQRLMLLSLLAEEMARERARLKRLLDHP